MKLSKNTPNLVLLTFNYIAKFREHRIQMHSKGKWYDIYNGSSIGNKHIVILKQPIKSKSIRIVIDQAVGKPKVTNFEVFNTST